MAVLQQNWLIMLVITAVSLAVNWYFGGRGRRFVWVVVAVLLALAMALLSHQLEWADATTATFVYGILVIYCPLMWIIALNKHDNNPAENKPVTHQSGNRY